MLIDKLKELKECLAGMMDTFPNPAVAVVTTTGEEKPKRKKAEVNKEENVQEKELR